jgi:murein DD-endopeptidase MepM/ murein hydrolase activator NlpD
VDALIPDSILTPVSRGQLIDNLADGVYAWQIDFTRDIHPGDRFVVLYERLVSALGETRYGRVLAASIETGNTENPAYVLSDGEGRNVYYDADGRSLRRAFKMYPVRFRRISSNFSRGRLHPVLRTTRAHLGTDYAADPGTPIYATADGTVLRAGRWGGYGIMVSIRHARGIETRYAHMQGLAKGIRAGMRVRQDQLIGFVGMTGLANGPHVHYEFLKNGRHINPRPADLGDGEPVPSARRAEFEAVRSAYDRMLGRQSQRSVAKVD